MQVGSGIKSVQHHDRQGCQWAQGIEGEPDRVDRAQSSVGDEHDDVGGEGRAQGETVAVGRQRRADAAGRLDQSRRRPARVRRRRPAQLRHEVLDGERRAAQRLGRHGGRHRHLVPAVRRADLLGRLAGGGAEHGRIEAGGVVVGLERLRRLAGGHPQARRAELASGDGRQPMSSRHRSPCRRRRPRGGGARPVSGAARPSASASASGSSASAWSNRVTSSSLCAADSVTRRRLVPTGTVGGRMAGTHRPSCEQRRRRVERRLLAAEHDRDDRARMSGRCEAGLGHPVDQRGEAARQGGAFGRTHDPERGERRRGVGRRGRGREDVRAGPVDDEVDDVAGRRHETAERAQRLGQRADPHDRSPCTPSRPRPPIPVARVPPGGRREVGAEDGVGLIEDEERVVAPAEGDELVEGGDVPIHGEDGVGDDDGRARASVVGVAASASSSARWPMSRWR